MRALDFYNKSQIKSRKKGYYVYEFDGSDAPPEFNFNPDKKMLMYIPNYITDEDEIWEYIEENMDNDSSWFN